MRGTMFRCGPRNARLESALNWRRIDCEVPCPFLCNRRYAPGSLRRYLFSRRVVLALAGRGDVRRAEPVTWRADQDEKDHDARRSERP